MGTLRTYVIAAAQHMLHDLEAEGIIVDDKHSEPGWEDVKRVGPKQVHGGLFCSAATKTSGRKLVIAALSSTPSQ